MLVRSVIDSIMTREGKNGLLLCYALRYLLIDMQGKGKLWMKHAAQAVVDGARLRILQLVDMQVRCVIDPTMDKKNGARLDGARKNRARLDG